MFCALWNIMTLSRFPGLHPRKTAHEINIGNFSLAEVLMDLWTVVAWQGTNDKVKHLGIWFIAHSIIGGRLD